MEYLLPLVDGFGSNRNSLDSVSNRNASRSDWVLVYGSSKLSVLKQRDLHKEWTFTTPSVHRYGGSKVTHHIQELRIMTV